MEIVIFFIILLALVLIHEWGHYIAAKKSGVRVEEFGFGLPPRLFGKKFGKVPVGEEDDRTLFSFNLLPIGGFVRMTGEDSVINDPDDPKNFQNAPLFRRMIIVLAGVFMNLVLGITLFSIVYSYTGIPSDPLVSEVIIKKVAPDSPASNVGMSEGDIITRINGQDVKDSESLISTVRENAEKEITLTLARGAESREVRLVPRRNPPPQQGSLGVELQEKIKTTFYPWYQMPFYGVAAGFKDTANMAQQIVPALGNLVSSIVVHQQVPKDVTGPVGIAKASSVFCGSGVLPCLHFAGLLSVNLAIFNLLPIPALDGGRFMFMLYEAITRRKANSKLEQWSHTVGFILLLILIILVTYKDIFFPVVLK